MDKKSVAEILIETLESMGVKRIFGIVGDSLNGILEQMVKKKNIAWIPMRHEEAAAFAAGAQAHLTGDLAVCAGSCGPGNLHLINGLYDCQRSRVPVLAIAAHIPSSEIGSSYFQETHPERLFLECSHYCELVSQPSQIPRILDIAIQTAMTKQGVSVITIPGDIALQKTAYQKPSCNHIRYDAILRPQDNVVQELAGLLNQSKKVTILGGAGCAGAHQELMTIAEKLKSPIVTTLRGREFVEYDNPFDVGLTGLIGYSSGYYAIKECDTLLMLGTDFPYRQFYPTKAKIIQVDSRGENLGKRIPLDLGVIGDVKETLKALNGHLNTKTDHQHLDQFVKDYQKVRSHLNELAVGNPGKKPIHPQFLAKTVDEMAASDTIFTCDVGTPTIWAARYLRMNGKRRLLGSFNHGSMANALPQAIGAQIAFPHRQVVTFSGDGGLSMLLGDLITIKQLNLPVKVVVFNNGAYSFVELEMKAAGFIGEGTKLENPNFSELAKSMGIHGARVEDPAKLKPALDEAFKHSGPALIEVLTNREELSMPPTITFDEALGFNLWAVKAVLNGRGNEVVDLAVSNFFSR